MPTYEYDCAACGGFEETRPMAQYDQPQPCPGCGALAPRAFSVPAMAMMDGASRSAQATNERSANAPQRVSGAHAGNCGCCRPAGRARLSAESVKAPAAGARPWMISH